MKTSAHLAGAVLTGVLLLPGPATTSRGRDFCAAWLRLADPAKQVVLRTAETAEMDGPWDLTCRAGMRSGIRHLLDSECSNWTKLMDFEIRTLVDRVLRSCVATPPARAS